MENNELTEKIDNFLKNSNLKTSVKTELILGVAGDALVENAAENGIDIKGFSHSIDNFFVNHTLNTHGNEEKENKRGNVTVTEEDIKMIPDVLQNPDFIVYGAKTKTENNAIIFAKNINGSTIFVEEVRNGKKKLAAQTLYKLPRTIDVSFIKNAPNLYAHSDPRTIKIVDVKKDIVNRMFIKTTDEEKTNEKVFLSKPITIVVTQFDEKHNPITDNNGNPVTATLHCNKGLGVALGTLIHRNAVLERDNELLRKQLNMYKTNNISQADDSSWSD